MIPFLGNSIYAADNNSFDKIYIDFPTDMAYPAYSEKQLFQDICNNFDWVVNDGSQSVATGYVTTLYKSENRNGVPRIDVKDGRNPIDPSMYYFVEFDIIQAKDLQFKQDNGVLDPSFDIIVNGTHNGAIVLEDGKINEGILKILVPVQVDQMDSVRRITINCNLKSVERGQTLDMIAEVVSYGEGFDKLEWTLAGAQSEGTYIDENGNLVVAQDESATTITVRATSVKNPQVFDEKTFNVVDELKIDSVSIEGPSVVEGARNHNYQFKVNVVGSDSHYVDWKIEGDTDSYLYSLDDSKNDVNLAIWAAETADTIQLKATSRQDPSKNATVQVKSSLILLLTKYNLILSKTVLAGDLT